MQGMGTFGVVDTAHHTYHISTDHVAENQYTTTAMVSCDCGRGVSWMLGWGVFHYGCL